MIWEYQVVHCQGDNAAQEADMLGDMGTFRWELVSVSEGRWIENGIGWMKFYFKRPKETT